MGISRKDTIIVAVLVNVALLVALFATATKIEEERSLKQATAMLEGETHDEPALHMENVVTEVKREDEGLDEIDKVLQEYAQKQNQVIAVDDDKDEPAALPQTKQKEATQAAVSEKQTPAVIKQVVPTAKKEEVSEYLIVKVKKGDVLSKIAKAHGVSVEEIMQLNALNDSKLRIGQPLKIPSKKKIDKKPLEMRPKINTKNQGIQAPVSKESREAEYYVIKSGDNPWKVARKFNIEFEDLLRLNNLDEEKARNLKIGQKIRIR